MSDVDTSGQAVVSGTGGEPTGLKGRKHRLKIVAIGLAAIILAVVLFMIFRPAEKPLSIYYDPNTPSDYMQLTSTQIRSKLYHDTGLDIDALKTQQLSGHTFKNFKAAHETAEAFRGLHDYKKSQQVYAIAAAKADNTTTYDFYIEYTAVADINGDKTTSKTMTEKTKQAIQADGSLKTEEKQDLIDTLTSKQRLKDLND